MSDLIAQMKIAQRDAGERAVITHLERTMGALGFADFRMCFVPVGSECRL